MKWCRANILRVLVRLAVAKKYNIREEVGHAACVTLCCCCCADGQVQNEIMVREPANTSHTAAPRWCPKNEKSGEDQAAHLLELVR